MKNKIDTALIQGMKEKNLVKLNTLRALKSSITNFAISKKGNIDAHVSENEIITLVRHEIKKRNESLSMYKNAGRIALAENEAVEISILNQFLPVSLTKEELDNFVDSAIVQLQATGKKDMGKVIKKVLELADGKIENSEVSKAVASKLI